MNTNPYLDIYNQNQPATQLWNQNYRVPAAANPALNHNCIAGQLPGQGLTPQQLSQLNGQLGASTGAISTQNPHLSQMIPNVGVASVGLLPSQMQFLQEQQLKQELASQLGISAPASYKNNEISTHTGNGNSSQGSSGSSSGPNATGAGTFQKFSTTTKHHVGSASIGDKKLPQHQSVVIELSSGKRKRSYAHIADPADRRRVRNREVAKSSRDAKKHYVTELEKTISDLRDKNVALEMENNQLRSKFEGLLGSAGSTGQLQSMDVANLLGNDWQVTHEKPEPDQNKDPAFQAMQQAEDGLELELDNNDHHHRHQHHHLEDANHAHYNSGSSTSSSGQDATQIRTDITIENITLPDNKRIKQNIHVEQDYDGVANKFTAYKADCQGTMTINREGHGSHGQCGQGGQATQVQAQHTDSQGLGPQKSHGLAAGHPHLMKSRCSSGTSSGTSGTGDLQNFNGHQHQSVHRQNQQQIQNYNLALQAHGMGAIANQGVQTYQMPYNLGPAQTQTNPPPHQFDNFDMNRYVKLEQHIQASRY